MSIREKIKIKIINELARELAATLEMSATDIPHLLSKDVVRNKLELEAENYLEQFHKKVLIGELENHASRLESCINNIKLEMQTEVRKELEVMNRVIINKNIDSQFSLQKYNGNTDKTYLKELIAKNQAEEVILSLLSFTKEANQETYNEIIVHYSKLRKLTMDCRIGNITREIENQERNKINHDLLMIVDSILI